MAKSRKDKKGMNKEFERDMQKYGHDFFEWRESNGYPQVLMGGVLVTRVPLSSKTSTKHVAENVMKKARLAKRQGLSTIGYSS